MYGNINKLMREKEKLDDLINNYQTQVYTQPRDLIEWRILNENEEVDNLYVQNKTLFISDNLMVLKGVDGSLKKWEIKKVYPIDAYKWKLMAEECDNEEMKAKYMNVSTMLYDMFMVEHNNIGAQFKKD